MLFIAAFMFLSACISYINGRDSAYYPLLLSSLLTALLGAFPLIFVERKEQITNKEGYCIVVGAWLVAQADMAWARASNQFMPASLSSRVEASVRPK